MEPEPEPTSHKEWVDFVRDIFKSMGGDIVPPRRPGHHDIITPARDDFMLDFEYSCLSQHWDSSIRPHPKGSRRYEDPEWAARIQAQVYPNHSDVDWDEYVAWVSQGGWSVYLCNLSFLELCHNIQRIFRTWLVITCWPFQSMILPGTTVNTVSDLDQILGKKARLFSIF